MGHFCPKNLDMRRALAFFTVLPVRGGGILYKSPERFCRLLRYPVKSRILDIFDRLALILERPDSSLCKRTDSDPCKNLEHESNVVSPHNTKNPNLKSIELTPPVTRLEPLVFEPLSPPENQWTLIDGKINSKVHKITKGTFKKNEAISASNNFPPPLTMPRRSKNCKKVV